MVRLPQKPPSFDGLLAQADAGLLPRAFGAAARGGAYLHWDQLRRRQPPDGLTSEQWWLGVKLARMAQRRPLPLADVAGNGFSFTLPDVLLQGLDDITRRASGTVQMPELVANASTRDRYLVNSLMEEAITSSQLEGAVTTRQVAKEMLRTGRTPRTKSEQMIANNYSAMRFIREHRSEDLTPALVCQLHEILTEGTLDNPSAAGQLQLPGDVRVGVWSEGDNVQLHQPPAATELPERLAALCAFANGAGEGWLHPILRAVITHFMVGYDHYFVDGNGRTARALFYWVALKNEYWLLEFVAISRILKDAPARYAKSYLHTETDDGDVTYFAIEQVRVINQAIDGLHAYLARKSAEVASAHGVLSELGVNQRQAAIVEGILRGSVSRLTVASHARSHNVTLATARTDLRRLEELGVLSHHKEGRQGVWFSAPGVERRLAELSN